LQIWDFHNQRDGNTIFDPGFAAYLAVHWIFKKTYDGQLDLFEQQKT